MEERQYEANKMSGVDDKDEDEDKVKSVKRWGGERQNRMKRDGRHRSRRCEERHHTVGLTLV